MKRVLTPIVAVAALLFIPGQGAVTGAQPSPQAGAQLPPGPRTVHQSAMEIAMPQAPYEAVQMVLDFAPGSWTPPHSHGGEVLVHRARRGDDAACRRRRTQLRGGRVVG